MRLRTAFALAVVLSLSAAALPASAHKSKPPTGDSLSRNVRLVGETRDDRSVALFTDAAFQGHYAYQGTWDGFRIVDISRPWRPRQVSEVDCGTSQGDVSVYGDLVFRSVEGPTTATTVEETCTADPAPSSGFEGIQVFEVRKPWRARAHDLVAAVPTDCGSRTHTIVPDPRNKRVLVYVSSGFPEAGPEYNNDPVWGHECAEDADKFQIVEVTFRHPEEAQVISEAPLGRARACHDIGVLQTRRAQLAVCAGKQAVLFDISNPVEPVELRSFTAPGVGTWHSAALSWDGKIAVMGWEPGFGQEAECEASDPAVKKSLFFFSTETGKLLGTWTLPRAQSAVENCTVHNYTVVPTRKRNVLTLGAYQAGTWVVDFTDPAAAKTVAWADPAPLDPNALTLGGAWGSYWYNGIVYESNMTKGLKAYKVWARALWGAERLVRLNPQAQISPDRHGWWTSGWHW